MNKRTTGLFQKFAVVRTDGKSEPGKKHDGCEYFVLDLTHDKFAADAIKAYARGCATEYPILSADLINKAIEIAEREQPKVTRRRRSRYVDL